MSLTNLNHFDIRYLSIVDISRVSVHKGVGFVLLSDYRTHCERSENSLYTHRNRFLLGKLSMSFSLLMCELLDIFYNTLVASMLIFSDGHICNT